MHDGNKLGLLYFTTDDVARDDVAQADDVAVNDLSYDDVSLNKRENKNIILIIFKLHVSFYYKKNDDVAPGDVSFVATVRLSDLRKAMGLFNERAHLVFLYKG